MQDLTVSLVQVDLVWEDITQNLLRFDACLDPLAGKQDLILLPEMFNTGFVVKPEQVAETPGSQSMRWLSRKAAELDCVIAATMIIKESGYYYNRLIWMRPDGSFDSYDKRHLFRMGNEHLRFQPGKKKIIIDYLGWKIRPFICYDLRFPVWSKNTYSNGIYEYDLMIYLANWPEPRRAVWQNLLMARALENLSYVAGVNRTGRDGMGISYAGDTCLVDFKGQLAAACPAHEEHIATVRLSYDELRDFRQTFNVGPDWDSFALR